MGGHGVVESLGRFHAAGPAAVSGGPGAAASWRTG